MPEDMIPPLRAGNTSPVRVPVSSAVSSSTRIAASERGTSCSRELLTFSLDPPVAVFEVDLVPGGFLGFAASDAGEGDEYEGVDSDGGACQIHGISVKSSVVERYGFMGCYPYHDP